ncbi:MAG: hypothetical protein R2791_01030 [Saprospiraceae bacterium]
MPQSKSRPGLFDRSLFLLIKKTLARVIKRIFAGYLIIKTFQSMSKIFEDIKKTIAEAEADVTKFYAGNNAAGARVRKAMQTLKDLAQTLRKDVLETKNSR